MGSEMREMEVVYLAAAYRDDRGAYFVQRNIERARDCALWLWRGGCAVICPHMNTALLDGACEDSVWLRGDIEILKRCDRVFVLRERDYDDPDKRLIGMSAGVLKEIEVAGDWMRPVTQIVAGWPGGPDKYSIVEKKSGISEKGRA